jgi:hypothetical protein
MASPLSLRRIASPALSLGRALRLGAIVVGVASLSGCAGWWQSTFASEGGEVRLEGLGTTPLTLDGVLPFGAYAAAVADHTFYVSDVPLETLLKGGVRNGQFLHVQLMWLPYPGRTPVDETATNLIIRYVVVSEGQVGVYGGGGFAWPRGEAGKEDVSLVIEGSSLALLAKSDGFTDLLTPARLTGTIYAKLDDDATRRFRRGVSQLVTDGLGATRWVDGQRQPLSADQVVALVSLVMPDAGAAASAASAATTAGATDSRAGS